MAGGEKTTTETTILEPEDCRTSIAICCCTFSASRLQALLFRPAISRMTPEPPSLLGADRIWSNNTGRQQTIMILNTKATIQRKAFKQPARPPATADLSPLPASLQLSPPYASAQSCPYRASTNSLLYCVLCFLQPWKTHTLRSSI